MKRFVIIAIIFFIFIISYFCIETYTPKSIRILNLVLFSKGDYYDKMYDITSVYHRKIPFVDTIYYLYDDTIKSDYEYDSGILRIRGNETFLPGILDKTVKALIFAGKMDKTYDYYIRTNISTIVDFNRLMVELKERPIHYGAGIKMHIPRGYRDISGGIRDDRYEDLTYASGTCIIFSRELFKKMLTKIDKIDYSVIDDVSIGQFIRIYFPEYQIVGYEPLFVFTEKKSDKELFGNQEYKNYIFFRNRCANREDDIKKMKHLSLLL